MAVTIGPPMVESPVVADTRFSLRTVPGGEGDFGADVRAGLSAAQKIISPRYFYDDLGSALFEAICNLPEYYPTAAETEILRLHGREIAAAAGGVTRLVELGSGSARKTRLLFDALLRDRKPLQYIPIDVDAHSLERSGRELLAEYPNLRISAVRADLTRPSGALEQVSGPGTTLMAFLGSTIGNFEPRQAVALLRDIRRALRPGDSFLLGADLKKPTKILEAAYNDVLGVTAAFNLNLLQRINRELGGHFDLHSFNHRAFFAEAESRIEMHLVSRHEQAVRIDALDLEVSFGQGQTIHTENSYKYDDAVLVQMASQSGFELGGRWTDRHGWFADVLLRAR